MSVIREKRHAMQILSVLPPVMQLITAALRDANYKMSPTQLGVMAALTESACNLSELAEGMAVSLPTMSAAVSKMTQQGWVRRSRSPHDRRMLILEITPEGQMLLAEIITEVISNVAARFEELTAEQLAQLSTGMDILQRAFSVAEHPLARRLLERGDKEGGAPQPSSDQ